MTFHRLVPFRYLLTVIYNLEGWLYIFELLIDGITQESISILFIKLVGLIGSFRHPDAEIVDTIPVPGLELGYNPITLSERIWDPSHKIWLLSYLI